MEQNYIEKQVKNQIQLIVRETNSEVNYSALRFQSKLKLSNIFQIRNKGKGPPGRMRSPGMAYCPTRDNQPLAFNPQYSERRPERCPERCPELSPERCPEFIEGLIEGLIEGFTKGLVEGSLPEPVEGKDQIENKLQMHTKPNFLSQLNFTIMKKQILFLVFFILAALASISDSFGQMPASTIGTQSPTCTTGGTDSPLNPKPGKPYDYGVTIGNTGSITNPVTDYLWWATKNPLFVDGSTTPTTSPNWADRLTVGTGLIATGANYGMPTGGTQTMSITWSSLVLANTQYQGTSPTFVAVMAKGSCSDNIQVFEINPQPAFTVDITNIDVTKNVAEAYGNTVSSCVSPVVSATYNSGTKQIDMDYGKNTIYFEVISANFVTTWTPTISVTGLDSPAETASATIYYSWADAKAGSNPVETLSFTTDGSQVGTTALGSTVSDTSSGVSFWLAVTVDHNTYENLVARPITVTVDGMDTTGQWDLFKNCDTASAADQDDTATQVITPRPDIQDTTGDPATPAPGTFIIKTP